MQQFILPDLKFNKNNPAMAGVYKMVFDETYFYIGSSRNVVHRFWSWRCRLKTGVKKNFLVTQQFDKCKVVRFEVLEVLPKDVDTKIREDFYIKENWGNELLLNRCDNAYVNNSKRTKEQIENNKYRQKVAKFDRGGNLIQIYESIADAGKSVGISRHLNRCFLKQGLTVKGYIFKKVDKEGNIIEPPVIPRTKPFGRLLGTKVSPEGIKKIKEAWAKKKQLPDYVPTQMPHAKKVNQYTMDGQLVVTHLSVREAARAIGVKDHKQVQRILTGKRGKTAKGYIFKYA